MNTGRQKNAIAAIGITLLILLIPTERAWLQVFLWVLLVPIGLPLLSYAKVGGSLFSSSTDLTADEVFALMRPVTWYTAQELAKHIKKQTGKRVSSVLITMRLVELREQERLVGRERRPPQPSYTGTGNIWEYRTY
jgi:hypothetical protein